MFDSDSFYIKLLKFQYSIVKTCCHHAKISDQLVGVVDTQASSHGQLLFQRLPFNSCGNYLLYLVWTILKQYLNVCSVFQLLTPRNIQGCLKSMEYAYDYLLYLTSKEKNELAWFVVKSFRLEVFEYIFIFEDEELLFCLYKSLLNDNLFWRRIALKEVLVWNNDLNLVQSGLNFK